MIPFDKKLRSRPFPVGEEKQKKACVLDVQSVPGFYKCLSSIDVFPICSFGENRLLRVVETNG